jgi:CRISPR-associated helicase Cas3/CRISPR-associated endonuclease Cas3-HD
MGKMNFYAHSIENQSKEKWQLLKAHLEAVSRFAEEFATSFNAGDLGSIVGLLHDVGKYSGEFQGRLEDPRIRVDHSTPGARIAVEQYGVMGRLFAYAVAGHHGGIPDGGNNAVEGTLANRIDLKNLPDFSSYSNEIELSRQQLKINIEPQPGRRGFSVSFFIRMLFSCLVDADFLDTESFFDLEKSLARYDTPKIDELASSLEDYLHKITTKAPSTKVNRMRAQVLDDCLNAASKSKGIFTLTVPTGGGKTLSSLAFALKHAKMYDLDRIIYVIPFTSIIEQNADVFRKAVGSDGVLEHHSNVVRSEEDDSQEVNEKLELAEENWDMPLVVTTNVQFFESLFSNKVSRCRKLHNIARSVIILDEAQMLPIELLKPCVAALTELVMNYGSTVVLCSATQPALEGLFPKGITPQEITRDPKSLYTELKRVEVQNRGQLDNREVADEVLRQNQVLCIVNTRSHARNIFELIGEKEGHYHLSAAMYPAHRSQKLEEIRKRLNDGQTCRVISTQLIEAGVDVDFPMVIRAITGVDSIAQAAGRCNREGRLEQGKVLVFTPEGGEGLNHLWFKRTAAITTPLLDKELDLLSLEVVNEYFNNLYFYEGTRLDEHKILDKLEEGASSLNFPFEEIARLFKIIGDDTYSIVIPHNDECKGLLAQADFVSPRKLARRLQRYIVSVHPWEYKKLVDAASLEKVGRYIVLREMSLYDSNYGLITTEKFEGGDGYWII